MRPIKLAPAITSRSTTLERYLREISQIDLLTVEQEIELSNRIKNGDRDALNKLVRANLLFVVSVAKKYQCTGFTLEDLICEGNVGLITAAERFDSTRGFKFISFAVWWIRRSIIHAIAEKQRLIRLPSNIINIHSRIRKQEAELEQRIHRQPSLEELADFMDLKPEEVLICEQSTASTYSLDEAGHEDEGFTLLDVLENSDSTPPDEDLIKVSVNIATEVLLDRLGVREQEIMKMSFGIGLPFPMDMDTIAKKLNLSGERIKQIRRAAMNRLQRYTMDDLYQL